jgi:hypothetical protein
LSSSVYVHNTQPGLPFGDPICLRVTPQDVQQSVGSIVWGHGASAEMLFASSESQRQNDYSGFHVAFDPDQRRCVFDFSAKGSGDAMALDPEGNSIPCKVMELSHTDFLLLQVPNLLYVLQAQTLVSTA